MSKRVFKPSGKFIPGTNIYTNVDRWEWTKNTGLRVVYTCGLVCNSQMTLSELSKSNTAVETFSSHGS